MLAIAGGKGGCGKTTTTHRLAAELARLGETPLAVDADAEMPDLHLVADVPAGPGLPAVTAGDRPRSVAHRTAGGVDVLPTDGIAADAVPAALRRFRTDEGPVLVDCPAGAGRDATRPLRAATRTLLVTTPTPAALRDTLKTAAMARTVETAPIGVVIVDRCGRDAERSDGRSARSANGQPSDGRLTDADARRLFDCPLLGRVSSATRERPPAAESGDGYATLARTVHKRNI
ncbi:MinD/ParA family ATP-binding protein [Halorientalis litorea]|uniref:MinD/ParA family ATP-binding protein n=1 Tax=Halorientalis litorea TaxID=2931977 RepID=UPI001FF1CCEE|nr:AAA family ATPase [Halorientalis litorea]